MAVPTEQSSNKLARELQDHYYFEALTYFGLASSDSFRIGELAECLMKIAYEHQLNSTALTFKGILPYIRRLALTFTINNMMQQYIHPPLQKRVETNLIIFPIDLLLSSQLYTIEPIKSVARRATPILFHLDRIGWTLAETQLDNGVLTYIPDEFRGVPIFFEVTMDHNLRDASQQVLAERLQEVTELGVQSHYETSDLCKGCAYWTQCPAPIEKRKGMPQNHFKISWTLNNSQQQGWINTVSEYLAQREYIIGDLRQIFYCPRQTNRYNTRLILSYLDQNPKLLFHNFYRRALFEYFLKDYKRERVFLFKTHPESEIVYETYYYTTPTNIDFIPFLYSWYEGVATPSDMNLAYLISKLTKKEIHLVYFPLRTDNIQAYQFKRSPLIREARNIYNMAYEQMQSIAIDTPSPSPRCNNCFVLPRCPEGKTYIRSTFGKKIFKTASSEIEP